MTLTATLRIKLLSPADYRRTPWKNGGGVAIDIAGQSRPGTTGADWNDSLWRFGRTTIATGAPFSDLSGFDRLQMVVLGRGLVLQTPDGEIDVQEPFKVVRFAGETPIVSRLEAGQVDVVNLLADRRLMAIDLRVIDAGVLSTVDAGTHVIHAAREACTLHCNGVSHAIAIDHSLQIDVDGPVVVEGLSGSAIVASVYRR